MNNTSSALNKLNATKWGEPDRLCQEIQTVM